MKSRIVGHRFSSEDSRKWLIFSTQCHPVVISSGLSPSEEECDTNPSGEQKNAAVFANRISWRKITSLTNQPGERNKCTSRQKNIVTSNGIKKLVYAGPKSARNILTNLSPNPDRPEKPGSTYNSV